MLGKMARPRPCAVLEPPTRGRTVEGVTGLGAMMPIWIQRQRPKSVVSRLAPVASERRVTVDPVPA